MAARLPLSTSMLKLHFVILPSTSILILAVIQFYMNESMKKNLQINNKESDYYQHIGPGEKTGRSERPAA